MDQNTAEKTAETTGEKTPQTTDAPKSAASPAADAPKTTTSSDAGKTVAKTSASASKPVVAKKPAAVAKAKVAEVPKKRVSKIAPLQAKMLPLIEKGPMTVQALAAKLDCSERQVRQAIDRARGDSTLDRKKANIVRLARNTFGYGKPKVAA